MNEKRIIAGYYWPSHWDIPGVPNSIWSEAFKEDYPDQVIESPESEVILEGKKKYKLIIDYPLHNEFHMEFTTTESGLTRLQLAELVVKSYKFIYESEKKTSTIKEDLIPGMLNRVTTNGDYGIWGHRLEDLTIGYYFLNKSSNIIKITLSVDS